MPHKYQACRPRLLRTSTHLFHFYLIVLRCAAHLIPLFSFPMQHFVGVFPFLFFSAFISMRDRVKLPPRWQGSQLGFLLLCLTLWVQFSSSFEESSKRKLITNISGEKSVMQNIAPSLTSRIPSWSASTDPCLNSWSGVTCDTDGYITSIDLYSIYCATSHDLSVSISIFSSLSSLTKLTTINLRHCGLSGSDTISLCCARGRYTFNLFSSL
jgi:hypothetical protein